MLVSVSEAASLSPFSGLLVFTAIPVHLPPISLCLSALQCSLSFCLLVPSFLLTPPILHFYFIFPSLSDPFHFVTSILLLNLATFCTIPWVLWFMTWLMREWPLSKESMGQHLSFLSKNAVFQRASEWIPPMGLPVNISSESYPQSLVLLSFLFHGKDSTVLSYALCTS